MIIKGLLSLSFSLAVMQCLAQGKTNNAFDSLKNESRKFYLYTADSSIKNDRQTLFLNNLANLIHLQKLDNNSDSLHIRIWLWETDIKYVIDIKRNMISVTGINSFTVENKEYIVIRNEHNVYLNKRAQDELLNKINFYKIRELNSGKARFDLTHSSYINFQLVDKHNYRYYEFLEPGFYRNVDTSAKKVYYFLKYINKLIGIKLYDPSTDHFKKGSQKSSRITVKDVTLE